MLTIGNASNLDSSVAGDVGGTGALTKDGAGTLTLSGNNSYGGTTTVAAGTLKLGHVNALGGTAGGTTIQSGATLDLNGAYAGRQFQRAGQRFRHRRGWAGCHRQHGRADFKQGVRQPDLERKHDHRRSPIAGTSAAA